jgi:putative addiction module killer protein
MYEVRRYMSSTGKDIYTEWVSKLRDRKVRIALDRRIYRIESGNLGDHKYLKDGVSELRIDVGPGYRVYYGMHKSQIVLLLCGGDKSTQSSDIERACAYWQDWRNRADEESE